MIKSPYNPYIQYNRYSRLPFSMIKLLAENKVGRNGWPVMAVLLKGVHPDRTIDRTSAEEIATLSGLTPAQVARGMQELRDKGLIVASIRKTKSGYRHLDRSNFGHVAQYCLTKHAWGSICEDIDPQSMPSNLNTN